MFTGLIEAIGIIKNIKTNGSNLTFEIQSEFSAELKIDESVAHNGICLTVENQNKNTYHVTAVSETIEKTTISSWKKGDFVNLERSLQLGDRLGGHLVQGHIDTVAQITDIYDQNGSKVFTFAYNRSFAGLIVEKGSISLNGTSLTTFNLMDNKFSVAIIPYTFENTILKYLSTGDWVNVEFDMIGKYFQRNATLYFENSQK